MQYHVNSFPIGRFDGGCQAIALVYLFGSLQLNWP